MARHLSYWAVALTLSCGACVLGANAPTYSAPGETVIGVFAALHGTPQSPSGECGGVEWRGVENAIAAEWALKAINNQSDPRHHIGLRVMDTCGSSSVADNQLKKLLQDMTNGPPLIGVVSTDETSKTLLPELLNLSIPLVVTSPEAVYAMDAEPTLFAAVPLLTTQMQSVVAGVGRLLKRAGGRVGVVWSCQHSVRTLEREASKAGLVVTLNREVTSRQLQDGQSKTAKHQSNDATVKQQILHFAADNNMRSGDVVVLLLKVKEFRELVHGPRDLGTEASMFQLGVRWLVASVEDDPLTHELDVLQLDEILPGVVVVGPHSAHMRALQRNLSEEVCNDNTTALSLLAPVLHRYCQTLTDQEFPSVASGVSGSVTSLHRNGPNTVSVDASHAAAVLRAVSTLAAAFRMVQLDHCSSRDNCTETIREGLSTKMVESLQHLSSDDGSAPNTLRYISDGHLTVTFSIVTVVRGEMVEIGQYREHVGVEWTGEAIPAVPASHRPFKLSRPLEDDTPHSTVQHKGGDTNRSDWRTTAWSVVICTTAAMGMVACCCIGTYVGIRTCDGTLKGTEVSSVLLLLGTGGVLMSSVVMILPVAVVDMTVLCCMQHILPYTALALSYAALVTKALLIRLQQAVDSRAKIPQIVLYLPLVALVALAVLLAALGDQTTLQFILPNEVSAPLAPTSPSHVISLRSAAGYDGHVLPHDMSYQTIHICKRLDEIPAIIGFVYLIAMLLVTLFMLATAKDNKNSPGVFHECRRVMAVSGISTPLVAMWGTISLYAPLHLQQPLAALSLVLLAYALLALFLLPKLRHMAAPNVKQFSHKPLGSPSSVSTVFEPPPGGQVVSYSSRGDDGGCRFSDVMMCSDLIDKYKLRDTNQRSTTPTSSSLNQCHCVHDSSKMTLY